MKSETLRTVLWLILVYGLAFGWWRERQARLVQKPLPAFSQPTFFRLPDLRPSYARRKASSLHAKEVEQQKASPPKHEGAAGIDLSF